MSGKTFVDTNVLIYAHDVDAGGKHETAKEILRSLSAQRTGILSTQVLQEFYVSATRKIAMPLTKSVARAVVDTTPADVTAAFRIEDEARISLWGALIIASAHKAGAVRTLPEDLNSGQIIAGV